MMAGDRSAALLLLACAAAVRGGGLSDLTIQNSLVAALEPNPESLQKGHDVRKTREVMSGHYVRVDPEALPEPYYIAHSEAMCADLGLDAAVCSSDEMIRIFSGDSAAARANGFERGWATAYALSIYGQEMVPNNAGRNGWGYGDGRAISIGEIVAEDAAADALGKPATQTRWELQLKGAGKTPFSRNSDGRAVLRSSVREFVAQEAMFYLGVPTTRSLSLMGSRKEKVQRAWYKNASADIAQGVHNPEEAMGGDEVVEEFCAISTRVSPSFIRVGQFELFGRRAREVKDTTAKRQLEQLARHAMQREYPEVIDHTPDAPLQPQLLALCRAMGPRFAALAKHWLRVGYTQSNFNADNCLVGGRTMDYGPFGFLERYDPKWGMWVGSGEHFSFMNQPNAMGANLAQLYVSLVPLLDPAGTEQLQGIIDEFWTQMRNELNDLWASKLGFPKVCAASAGAFLKVEGLMAEHPTDFTILWRNLAAVVEHGLGGASMPGGSELLALLAPAFYSPLPAARVETWTAWLAEWLGGLKGELAANREGAKEAAARIRKTSPKYVAREWMLVPVYKAAERGDYAPLHELLSLLKRPYDEQPEFEARFYRRAPPGSELQGGVGFMS